MVSSSDWSDWLWVSVTDIQSFHQSGWFQSGVGISQVKSKWNVGLERTTDCQSCTGRTRSGPVYTHLQIHYCFIVRYHWNHDSSWQLITTHHGIPSVGEIMTGRSVCSIQSRYISHIKRLISSEIFPNSGHSTAVANTIPVQSSSNRIGD